MLKKLGLLHYLTFLAVLLAMVLIGLVLLRVPGPVRSAFVPPTQLVATMDGGEVSYSSDASGCEAFDLGPRSWLGHGSIKMWPGERRGLECYAVPSDTEITITWEYWDWKYHSDVAKFFLNGQDNLIGEVHGGDTGNEFHDTYSITTTFPADMPPSLLSVRGYHNGLAASSAPIILFVDQMAPTPSAPECQGFRLDPGDSIGYGELTISPSDQHGRRCYAVPADTEITLTWKKGDQCYLDVSFTLNRSGEYDYIDADCEHDGVEFLYSATTTFPADMPPSQLWVETWDDDMGSGSAPVIIFIER